MTQQPPTRQQTLQQRRAAAAWEAISSLDQGRDERMKKDYGSLVRGLPALIQSDGLGQTLAFLQAKAGGESNNAHALAYNHLSTWVCAELKAGENSDLMQWVLTRSTNDYRRAANEALAYLSWLKRFAEAKGWKGEDNPR